jgi:hypothetical protein
MAVGMLRRLVLADYHAPLQSLSQAKSWTAITVTAAAIVTPQDLVLTTLLQCRTDYWTGAVVARPPPY